MTRKHFQAVADAIKANSIDIDGVDAYRTAWFINRDLLVNDLCSIFSTLNPNFNKQKFIDACNA